jgi:hypothetical protein
MYSVRKLKWFLSLFLAAKIAGLEEIAPTDLHGGNATLLKHKNGHVVAGAKEYTTFICDCVPGKKSKILTPGHHVLCIFRCKK